MSFLLDCLVILTLLVFFAFCFCFRVFSSDVFVFVFMCFLLFLFLIQYAVFDLLCGVIFARLELTGNEREQTTRYILDIMLHHPKLMYTWTSPGAFRFERLAICVCLCDLRHCIGIPHYPHMHVKTCDMFN